MGKLSVVIATLNSKYIHSSLAPWCLLAGVKSYCTNVNAVVIEGTINQKLEDVAEKIISTAPQAVGLSCYIWNITLMKQLIVLIKMALPNTIIILGGPEVSYNARNILCENNNVDYIISGEGEKPFAVLLNSIADNKPVPNNMGICYNSSQGVIISQPYISTEQPPTPYTEEYFKALNGRIAYLETSRGCPYSCAFCLSGRCGKARFFDAERAKQEMLLLANSGTQTIKLVDRTFNANKKRAYMLFEFIIQSYGTKIPKGVCFHFEIAGDILDEATIALLKTAPVGAIQLEIGLQSFNEVTLEYINRKTNTAKLKENILQLVANNNMHIHIDLIAGLPYEDFASFRQSFNIAYSLNSHMLQLGFLKLLYGAEMRENTQKYSCTYNTQPPYEVTGTKWLSDKELKSLHMLEDALDRINNSGRFTRTIKYIISTTPKTPFDVFLGFGEFAYNKGTGKISLDEYTKYMYNYFSGLENVDKQILRDYMVLDRLSTNASGLLPQILRVQDQMQKKVRLMLEEDSATKVIKGIKRGIAILYTQNKAVYVDYINKNPINGEYKLNYCNLPKQ